MKPCEIYLEGNQLIAYVPSKGPAAQRIELAAATFVAADGEARALGYEPSCGT